MTKYYYVISRDHHDYSRDELQHFDLDKLSKLKLPEIKIPKFDIPKVELPKISTPKIELPKITVPKIELPKIDLPKIDLKNGSKESSSKSNGSGGLGGSVGREWKEHKWIDRKRNKDGKWIYDYGDGFPDEENGPKDEIIDIKPDEDIKLADVSPLAKLLGPLSGLGDMLVGPGLDAKLEGGKRFLGSIEEGLNNIKLNMLKFGTKTDLKSGFQMKNDDKGKEFDLKSLNPGYNNPDEGSQRNCPCCSVAYDMRRRGYEVKAKQTTVGLDDEEIVSFYNNPKVHNIKTETPIVRSSSNPKNTELTNAVNKQLSTEPEGSRGIAWMKWNDTYGGHAVAYEIENGKAYIYDAQSGNRLDMSTYVDRAYDFKYFRTDDLEPNYNQIKKVVE